MQKNSIAVHSVTVYSPLNVPLTVVDICDLSECTECYRSKKGLTATEMVMRSWQRKWNEDSTGRATYSFILEVITKVIFQRKGKLVYLIAEFYCMIIC